MNLENCSFDLEVRASNGQFTTTTGGERKLQEVWFARTDDGISIRLDGGIQLSVTAKLTNAAAREFAATLLRFLDGDAEQPPGTSARNN